jgi:hypothetical protein
MAIGCIPAFSASVYLRKKERKKERKTERKKVEVGREKEGG